MLVHAYQTAWHQSPEDCKMNGNTRFSCRIWLPSLSLSQRTLARPAGGSSSDMKK
jgi:hypothetical protein